MPQEKAAGARRTLLRLRSLAIGFFRSGIRKLHLHRSSGGLGHGCSPLAGTTGRVLPFWAIKISQPTQVDCDIRAGRCPWRSLTKWIFISGIKSSQPTKMSCELGCGNLPLAERRGFEPRLRSSRKHDFQSCAFSHSAISPRICDSIGSIRKNDAIVKVLRCKAASAFAMHCQYPCAHLRQDRITGAGKPRRCPGQNS